MCKNLIVCFWGFGIFSLHVIVESSSPDGAGSSQGFNAYSDYSWYYGALLFLGYWGTSWLKFLLCASFKVFW